MMKGQPEYSKAPTATPSEFSKRSPTKYSTDKRHLSVDQRGTRKEASRDHASADWSPGPSPSTLQGSRPVQSMGITHSLSLSQTQLSGLAGILFVSVRIRHRPPRRSTQVLVCHRKAGRIQLGQPSGRAFNLSTVLHRIYKVSLGAPDTVSYFPYDLERAADSMESVVHEMDEWAINGTWGRFRFVPSEPTGRNESG